MTNQDVARILRNVAAAYSIKDEKKHRFQIIAYQKASEIIQNATFEVSDLLKQKHKVPGIGESILSSIDEFYKTGRVLHFEEITKGIPKSVFVLLDIPSFGPKKAYKLVTTLKLNNPETVIEDLQKAATEGKVAIIPTFGKKSEQDILKAIEDFSLGATKTDRMVLPYAFELSNKILAYLRQNKDVLEAYPLGSLRRMMPTVGDIDIAVATNNPKSVIDHFVNYPGAESVIEKGDRSSSIFVSGGKHVDLMVEEPESFGALLQHFTGSKYHNVALRELAIKKGYSLSEKGIKIKNKNNKMQKIKTEEKFYEYLGLTWIPPELRENQGEIEIAQKHNIPKLVELKDIKADFHIHSSYDLKPSHDLGHNTMEEMIQKANKLNYDYLGFSEHNPSITNHSLQQINTILSKRYNKIEQIKKSNKSIRIINLLEVDILPTGKLAIDDNDFKLIDAAIVSIHSSFSMNKEDMTNRVINGLSHPKAKILAHPTGRLLNQRAGYELDWDRLFDFVKQNNKAIEINAWPTRLDLPDTLVKRANEMGIKFVINTDSHADWQMDNMFYGVAVARRGWCTKESILNTLPYEKFCNWLST